MTPETRYARSGDVNIAYQVVGDAPRDLVLVPGWVSNIEVFWEEPACARFLERLASFTRLILFDKRGTGLSDRVADLPNLETRMDDVRAVMDAVGSERAALFGYSEGGADVRALRRDVPGADDRAHHDRQLCAPDMGARLPLGRHARAQQAVHRAVPAGWGGPVGLDERWPSAAGDERVRAVVGAAPADGREPGRAPSTLLRMNCGDRHPARAAGHPRAHAGPPQRRRPGARHRRQPVPGRAHPRGEVRRAPPASIICPGGTTRTRSSTRSRSSSPVSATAPSRTASWPPSSSPTSSAPPSGPPPRATAAGAMSSNSTTPSCAVSSAASAAARSTRRATGSSPPSTGPRAGSAAPAR